MPLKSLLFIWGAIIAVCSFFSSCVHEMPKAPNAKDVEITVTHSPTWQFYEHIVSRADADAFARYHFVVTPAGNRDIVIAEREFLSPYPENTSFTVSMPIPKGECEIWVWRDMAHPHTGKSLHFDTSDFSSIYYTEPYEGNSPLRDAFRGSTSFTVDPDISSNQHLHTTIELERPLASYSFVATDLEEFVEKEIARSQSPALSPDLAPILATYKVKMIYTGYMPSRFNNFINRPVDSKLGVTYDSSMKMVENNEALLAFDHVLVNGHESSIPVRMELYDPNGMLVSKSSVVNVPIVRGRHTIVRGRFLTSKANAGVGINPDFNGDYNIEIR